MARDLFASSRFLSFTLKWPENEEILESDHRDSSRSGFRTDMKWRKEGIPKQFGELFLELPA